MSSAVSVRIDGSKRKAHAILVVPSRSGERFDVLGPQGFDNYDVTAIPTHAAAMMTAQTLHWYLLMESELAERLAIEDCVLV